MPLFFQIWQAVETSYQFLKSHLSPAKGILLVHLVVAQGTFLSYVDLRLCHVAADWYRDQCTNVALTTLPCIVEVLSPPPHTPPPTPRVSFSFFLESFQFIMVRCHWKRKLICLCRVIEVPLCLKRKQNPCDWFSPCVLGALYFFILTFISQIFAECQLDVWHWYTSFSHRVHICIGWQTFKLAIIVKVRCYVERLGDIEDGYLAQTRGSGFLQEVILSWEQDEDE